jgi:hypothetical protein
VRLSGFADEAADGLERQITATKALGWSMIELRGIGGINVVDLAEGEFELLRDRLEAKGISVPCLGSTIPNWGKSVDGLEEPPGELLWDEASRKAISTRMRGDRLWMD